MSEGLVDATVRLISNAEAVAALAAHVRIRTEGIPAEPAVADLLASIAAHLVGTTEVEPNVPAASAVAMTRALLGEAAALVDDPGRSGGWSTTDPAVLQGFGRTSMSIAPVIAAAVPNLHGLGEALARPSASVLDVGTGVGWLAIALARTFPNARIVGIDIFEPALALARTNVSAEPGGERVEIRHTDVTALTDREEYDAVWLPLPFLPHDIVGEAARRAHQALRPGGWLLPGSFAGPDEPLPRMLTELRIRRSGGYPWSLAELPTVLTSAGFVDVHEITRTWPAPVQLFAARKAD